jgi:hypothetical protein
MATRRPATPSELDFTGRDPSGAAPSRIRSPITESIRSAQGTPDILRRPSTTVPVPVPHPSHLRDAYDEDAERQRQEVLAEAERQLAEVLHQAEEAEQRREELFRQAAEAEERREELFRLAAEAEERREQREQERDRLFTENEARRDQEAHQRREEPLEPLPHHESTEGVPSILEVVPEPAPESLDGSQPESVADAVSVRESLHGGTPHARLFEDALETIKAQMERERQMAQDERDRIEADAAAMKDQHEARILALEQELATVKADLENERQQRLTDEAEMKERERAEAQERDELVRNQLGDITNLLQDQRDDCARKRDVSDERWAEQQRMNQECQELRAMIAKLVEDNEADRMRVEEERIAAESKPGMCFPLSVS